jgi:hypothetical protein
MTEDPKYYLSIADEAAKRLMSAEVEFGVFIGGLWAGIGLAIEVLKCPKASKSLEPREFMAMGLSFRQTYEEWKRESQMEAVEHPNLTASRMALYREIERMLDESAPPITGTKKGG